MKMRISHLQKSVKFGPVPASAGGLLRIHAFATGSFEHATERKVISLFGFLM